MQRAFAYQVAISNGNYKNPPTITEWMPLPYDDDEDDEIKDDDWITTFYNNATK